MPKKSANVNDLLTPSSSRRRAAHRPRRSLGSLIHRAGRHDAWTAGLRALLEDDIAPHCWVANLNPPVMTVYVRNAAWATRLRFEVPRLLVELPRLEDFRAVTDIRIKAQAMPDVAPPVTKKIDRQAPPQDLLEALAADTADTDLRDALIRLAHVERRSGLDSEP